MILCITFVFYFFFQLNSISNSSTMLATLNTPYFAPWHDVTTLCVVSYVYADTVNYSRIEHTTKQLPHQHEEAIAETEVRDLAHLYAEIEPSRAGNLNKWSQIYFLKAHIVGTYEYNAKRHIIHETLSLKTRYFMLINKRCN